MPEVIGPFFSEIYAPISWYGKPSNKYDSFQQMKETKTLLNTLFHQQK